MVIATFVLFLLFLFRVFFNFSVYRRNMSMVLAAVVASVMRSVDPHWACFVLALGILFFQCWGRSSNMAGFSFIPRVAGPPALFWVEKHD